MATETKAKTKAAVIEPREVRRITMNTLLGRKIGRYLDESRDGASAPMLVYGVARRAMVQATSAGPLVYFIGDFVAKRERSVFVSARCALPEPVQSKLYQEIKEKRPLTFAFELIVAASEQSFYGYEFSAKEVLEPQYFSPLAYIETWLETKRDIEAAANVY